MSTWYRYSFDDRLIAFWGVVRRPSSERTASRSPTTGTLRATFGFLELETPLENVTGAHITRNYRWWTAAGARGSMKDDGLTFGTNADAGVCIHFRDKVPSRLRRKGHSALTVTVEDLEGLVSALTRAWVASAHESDVRLDRRRVRASAPARSPHRSADRREPRERAPGAERGRWRGVVRAGGSHRRRARAVGTDDPTAATGRESARGPRCRGRAAVPRRLVRRGDGVAHRAPLARPFGWAPRDATSGHWARRRLHVRLRGALSAVARHRVPPVDARARHRASRHHRRSRMRSAAERSSPCPSLTTASTASAMHGGGGPTPISIPRCAPASRGSPACPRPTSRGAWRVWPTTCDREHGEPRTLTCSTAPRSTPATDWWSPTPP